MKITPVLLTLILLALPAAGAVDPFYQSLLREGVLQYDRGDYAGSSRTLRIACFGMLDEPKATKETYGFHTAGWNVAPVVKQVVARIGPLLGVAPDEGRDVDLTDVLRYVRPEKGE